jgi:sulfite oxidase
VPGYIGARSVKWLERIELRTEPSEGYYQAVAYRLFDIPLGEVALNSDFLSAEVEGGEVVATGYAFAGGERHVSRVEVAAGDGNWQEAELLDDQGRWAWRMWRATLTLPPGRHVLVARAWDSAGATQPEDPATVWNPKGYANSSWARLEVDVRPA